MNRNVCIRLECKTKKTSEKETLIGEIQMKFSKIKICVFHFFKVTKQTLHFCCCCCCFFYVDLIERAL